MVGCIIIRVKKIEQWFYRNGHNVLTMSDRDILTIINQLYPQGVKKFNRKVIKTFLNFRPDVLVLGMQILC